MLSERYHLVKGYYDAGAWKKKAVRKAVERGWITPTEYQEITGEPYAGM